MIRAVSWIAGGALSVSLISVSACSDPPGPQGAGGRAGVGGSSAGGVVTNGGAVSGGATSQGGTISAGGSTSQGGLTTTGGSAAGGASGGTTSATGGASTGGATGGAAGAATGGGGGAAPQGGSGGATVELKQPIRRDEKYVLEFGDTILEMDPAKGGRVTKFSYKGTNIVAGTDQTKEDINWGSVFWPSPQSAWLNGETWPPPAHIDSMPYTAALDGNTIVLTSGMPPTSSLVQLTVEKRISVDLVKQAIVMDFKMTNVGGTEKTWAAWQVTRVAAGGITFFPTGGDNVSNSLTVTKQGDVTWFNQATGVPRSTPPKENDSGKLITDAKEPWLAHAAGSLVFIKTFPAVEPSAFAPGEGEIEIYSTPVYEEIEPQGPRATLRGTASLSWSVRWYLRELPAAAKVAVGDAELVKFVRSIAQ